MLNTHNNAIGGGGGEEKDWFGIVLTQYLLAFQVGECEQELADQLKTKNMQFIMTL